MELSRRQLDLLGAALGLMWAGLSIIAGAEIARLGNVQFGHWVQTIGILLAGATAFATSAWLAPSPPR